MHHQVGVRQAAMNFFNPADGKNFTSRLTGKLVSTVAGANGDSQGIYTSLLNKVNGFVGVG
jgi:hypothetical protein